MKKIGLRDEFSDVESEHRSIAVARESKDLSMQLASLSHKSHVYFPRFQYDNVPCKTLNQFIYCLKLLQTFLSIFFGESNTRGDASRVKKNKITSVSQSDQRYSRDK